MHERQASHSMWTPVCGAAAGAAEDDWLRAASISSSDTSRRTSDVTLKDCAKEWCCHRGIRLSQVLSKTDGCA